MKLVVFNKYISQTLTKIWMGKLTNNVLGGAVQIWVRNGAHPIDSLAISTPWTEV